MSEPGATGEPGAAEVPPADQDAPGTAGLGRAYSGTSEPPSAPASPSVPPASLAVPPAGPSVPLTGIAVPPAGTAGTVTPAGTWAPAQTWDSVEDARPQAAAWSPAESWIPTETWESLERKRSSDEPGMAAAGPTARPSGVGPDGYAPPSPQAAARPASGHPPIRLASTAAPATRRRRGGRIAAVLAAVVVVSGATAAGVAVARSHTVPAPTIPVAVGPSISSPGPVLDPAADSAPAPTAVGLNARIAPLLTRTGLGAHVGIAVGDLSSGSPIYGYHASDPTTPASTMKLATTVALLSVRDPSYRITTRVVAGAQPGQVVLIAAGDPTLATGASMAYPESGRLDLLADQVKKALGSVKPTKLVVDASVYSGPPMAPGWQDSDVDSTYLTRVYALSTNAGRVSASNDRRSPNSQVAAQQAFAKDLGLPASAIVAGTAPKTPAHPAKATTPGAVLGSVQSAPLQRIIETMLSESDNMLAEAMARQVAIAMGRPASFAGAAAAVTAELGKLGLPTSGVHIVDGSGISHQDTLTPQLLGAILSYAAAPAHPELHALFTGLPIAGYEGTLAARYQGTAESPVDGEFRAKTGTLDGVYTLAGVMTDSSGRLLTVVIMADQAPAGGAPQAIDKIATAIHGCGCT